MVASAGLDGLFHIVQDEDGEDLAAKGIWQGDRFTIVIKTMRHPFEDHYQFTFADNTVECVIRDLVNGGTWRISGETP